MDYATRPAPQGGYSGAPPVPEGWAARFDERYQTWFYVNTHTKQSQWEPPINPVVPTLGVQDLSKPRYSEPVLYHASDEELARRLQAEEDNATQQRPVSPYAAPTYSPQPPANQWASAPPVQPMQPTQPTHETYHGNLAPPETMGMGGSLHGRKKSSWSDLKDTLTGKNLTEEDKNSKAYKIAEKIGDKVTGKGETHGHKDSKPSKDKKDGKSSKYAGKVGKAAGKLGGGEEDGGGDDGGGGLDDGGDDGGGIGEVIGAIFGA